MSKRAVINEDLCVGCMKCIQVCPVDAIVGAQELMHTVIESECIGCELCVAPCPMDCIDMREDPVEVAPATRKHLAQYYKQRVQARKQRLQQTSPAALPSQLDKKSFVAAAIARAQRKKHSKE
jgi:electron transport complex protein RnfB